jgi:hypothetical protein
VLLPSEAYTRTTDRFRRCVMSPQNQRRFLLLVSCLLTVLLFLLACGLPSAKERSVRERYFQAATVLVNRLNFYYQTNGEFPASLDLLDLTDERLKGVEFFYIKEKDNYSLSFAYLVNKPPLTICLRTKDTEWGCGRYR